MKRLTRWVNSPVFQMFFPLIYAGGLYFVVFRPEFQKGNLTFSVVLGIMVIVTSLIQSAAAWAIWTRRNDPDRCIAELII